MLSNVPGPPFSLVLQISKLPEAFLRVHRDWLAAQQQPDGGFPGRVSGSNLYYTAFAARGLALIGCQDQSQWQGLERFLRSSFNEIETLVDLEAAATLLFLCQLFATGEETHEVRDILRSKASNLFEILQRADGGLAKSPQSRDGSTYATFLALIVSEILDIPLPPAERFASFFLSRRRSDGGFVELPLIRESGTNPTAAAIMALSHLQRREELDLQGVLSFFRRVWREDGGFAASGRVPWSDLLSTCSSLIAISQLFEQSAPGFDWNATEAYVLSLAEPGGGFRGHRLDDQPDVEYTFYGLAALATIRQLQARQREDR